MKIYEVYLLCTFLSSATEKFFKKIFKITIDFLSWSIINKSKIYFLRIFQMNYIKCNCNLQNKNFQN